MPKIKFILLKCTNCQAEYKVRLERIEQREPFECVTCGKMVTVSEFSEILRLIYQFSAVVVEIEEHGKVEGELLIPKRKASSYPGD